VQNVVEIDSKKLRLSKSKWCITR